MPGGIAGQLRPHPFLRRSMKSSRTTSAQVVNECRSCPASPLCATRLPSVRLRPCREPANSDRGECRNENLCPLRPAVHRARGRGALRRGSGLRRARAASTMPAPKPPRRAGRAADRLIDHSGSFRHAGPDRRPHPPRLRQRQERGGHRPLQPARIPRAARHVLRPEGRGGRATPRSARRAMPARSASRSATRSAPASSTGRGSWRPGRTSRRIRA